MLKKLKIHRFKSIWVDEIDFGYANLFIGANGTGKSNILEAIGVLASIFARGLDPSELDLKGIRLSLPHIFKSAFKGHDLPKTFRLEAVFDHGRYDCGIRASATSATLEFFSEALYDGDRQVFGRSMHGINVRSDEFGSGTVERFSLDDNRSVWSVVGPLINIRSEFRAELEEFSRFAIYAPQTAVMRGLAVDNRIIEPLGLTGAGLASALEGALASHTPQEFRRLAKIIWDPGWADRVHIGEFDSEIVPSHVSSSGRLLYIRDKFMRTKRDYLSAFDASEGTLYLIFVAALLAHKDTPNIFALDNVDGTLNPRLVRSLTDHIVSVCKRNYDEGQLKQVFLTSHHPSALDSFDIFDEGQKIFVADRWKSSGSTDTDTSRANGSTFFREMKPPKDWTKDRWIIEHGGQNLSSWLLEGRIKGAL